MIGLETAGQRAIRTPSCWILCPWNRSWTAQMRTPEEITNPWRGSPWAFSRVHYKSGVRGSSGSLNLVSLANLTLSRVQLFKPIGGINSGPVHRLLTNPA